MGRNVKDGKENEKKDSQRENRKEGRDGKCLDAWIHRGLQYLALTITSIEAKVHYCPYRGICLAEAVLAITPGRPWPTQTRAWPIPKRRGSSP